MRVAWTYQADPITLLGTIGCPSATHELEINLHWERSFFRPPHCVSLRLWDSEGGRRWTRQEAQFAGTIAGPPVFGFRSRARR